MSPRRFTGAWLSHQDVDDVFVGPKDELELMERDAPEAPGQEIEPEDLVDLVMKPNAGVLKVTHAEPSDEGDQVVDVIPLPVLTARFTFTEKTKE